MPKKSPKESTNRIPFKPSKDNRKYLEELKAEYGSSFNWSINKALDLMRERRQ